MSELDGRVALVTGAGQGIGAATALRLAAAGARVAVNSLTPAKADAVTTRINEAGGRAVAVPADVAEPEAVDAMVRRVEDTLGPVEVLVNNAAFLSMAELGELTPDVWHRTVDVNLGGAVWCCHRVAPGMRAAGWGRIVSVSSIWGTIGAAGATAYCASKGGLIGLTSALADELGPHGVTVAAIAPGTVDTPQLEADAAFAGVSLAEMRRIYSTDTLLGRIASAEEIAGMIEILASDAGAAFHGQVVRVTGGRSE